MNRAETILSEEPSALSPRPLMASTKDSFDVSISSANLNNNIDTYNNNSNNNNNNKESFKKNQNQVISSIQQQTVTTATIRKPEEHYALLKRRLNQLFPRPKEMCCRLVMTTKELYWLSMYYHDYIYCII